MVPSMGGGRPGAWARPYNRQPPTRNPHTTGERPSIRALFALTANHPTIGPPIFSGPSRASAHLHSVELNLTENGEAVMLKLGFVRVRSLR